MNLDLTTKNVGKFVEEGIKIRDALNKKMKVRHPEWEHVNSIDLVEFYCEKTRKNVTLFGDASYTRCPCGTGTCA